MSDYHLKKASESATAAAVRRALGVGPDDAVSVTSSPHHRHPDDPSPMAYPGHATIGVLAEMRTVDLRVLGLRPWVGPKDADEHDPEIFHTHTLWLLPGEWYGELPEGLEVVDIMGQRETFSRTGPDRSDDDIRYGMLPYGILREGGA